MDTREIVIAPDAWGLLRFRALNRVWLRPVDRHAEALATRLFSEVCSSVIDPGNPIRQMRCPLIGRWCNGIASFSPGAGTLMQKHEHRVFPAETPVPSRGCLLVGHHIAGVPADSIEECGKLY